MLTVGLACARDAVQVRGTAYNQYGQLVVCLSALDIATLYETRYGTEDAYVPPQVAREAKAARYTA